MKRLRFPARSLTLAFAILMLAGAAGADTSPTVYTSNANFDTGTLFNVNHDTAGTLRLNTTLTTFSVMWIANAGEDSVSKIDTNTGAELARYKTGFNRGNHGVWEQEAPSRTAVDQDGNVYVANRNFHGQPAAVVKILASGGIDRNGNGVIDTATGSTPIQHVDDNGNNRLETSELNDERIAWVAYVGPSGALGRALALDQRGGIWLGTWDPGAYYKLDVNTGQQLAGPYNTRRQQCGWQGSWWSGYYWGCWEANLGNYGAVVDANGILWGATLGPILVRLDTNTGGLTYYDHSSFGNNYGIALGNGKIYLGGSGCDPLVFDPANGQFSRLVPNDCVLSYGLAVDRQGNIYTRTASNGVRKISPSGSVLWSAAMQPGFNAPDFRGLAVDSADNVWYIAISANNNLEKYRGSDGAALGVYSAGYMPYTYTDVTGQSSFNTTPSGKWTVTRDGGAASMHWGKADWNLEPEGTVPAGASITVRARAADSLVGLDAKTWFTMPKGVMLSEAQALIGRYVQLEATLTANAQAESPVLSDLSIEPTPDTQPPVVVPPANASYQCASQAGTPTVGAATVTDNRPGVTVVVSQTTNGGAGSTASPLVLTRTWTATDTSGNTASASQTITIIDTTAPVIAMNAGPATAECHTSYTDPGASATDNCGGSITVVASGVVDINTPGSYTITYSATDAAGNAAASVTRTVTVVDTTAPVPSVATLPVLTGQCSVTAVPPTALDSCYGSITGTTTDPTSYTQQGSFTITWTFKDGAGNSSSQTQTVIVKDTISPVPTLTSLPDVTGQCAAAIPAPPTALDACSGTITGTTSDATSYTQQGTYTVTWTFADAVGNTSTQTQKVVVKDTTAPSATAPSAVSTTTLACTLPVPDFTSNLNASDNCALASITQSPAAGTTAGLGTTPVTVTIKDHVGNTTTFTTSFTVVNLPPVVSAGGPYSVPEGGSVLLTSIASDPSGAPVVAWDLDNDGSFETLGVTATFSAASLDGPSSYIVRVLATDSCGQTAINQATVNVTNVAPVVTITQPGSFAGFAKGTPVTVVSTFTDAGKPDTHSCSINWDNPADVAGNVAAGTVTQGAGSGSCTASYTFAQPGIYTATVTITDDDGGAGTAQVVFAVFDPNAGKVTSGFWYDSAAGASVPSPGAAGRAYGEANPQMSKGSVKGDTKFRFDAAGLDFRSTTTDWLVAVSPRAAWHGFGTIGGTGKYEFLVIAQDGKAAGDSIDRVRIRIWNPATSEVIYDNVPASSNDLDTASLQSTTSGAITVHK